MSRRQRESNLEASIDLASRLPWWLGIVFAGIGYLILHRFAEAPPVPPIRPHEIAGAVTGSLVRGFATAGQYVVPMVLLAGAGVSALRAHRNRRLLAEARLTSGSAGLMELSWRDFEHLVGEAFRQRGFTVSETAPGPDGGIDLELRKNSELHLVQCKRWRARKVGVEIVRELYGVMSARGAVGGYVVSSGEFSVEAKRFAQGRNIDLWDGAKLNAVIRGVRDRPLSAQAPAPGLSRPPARTPSSDVPTAPTCPSCGAGMVRRTARRGGNPGREFWGCSTYPDCRGIRQIAAGDRRSGKSASVKERC